jgi:DNA helicase II / ATP-dependent DNA helicase PcrA
VDLGRFSPQQCAAITAGEGPPSILAGPGSGKTTTLAGRIAYLVMDRSVPPTSILAITFTTAAAAALRRQLQTVLGDSAAHVDIRTFHSFELRVIRSWSEELGFGNTPPAVYGREDARAVVREAARELGLAVAEHAPVEKHDPWAISLAQLDHALERYRLRCAREDKTTIIDETEIDVLDGTVLADLASAYERRLKDYAAVDYPGMLTLPLHLLEENSGRCTCSRTPIAGSSSTSTRIAVGSKHRCCSNSHRDTTT